MAESGGIGGFFSGLVNSGKSAVSGLWNAGTGAVQGVWGGVNEFGESALGGKVMDYGAQYAANRLNSHNGNEEVETNSPNTVVVEKEVYAETAELPSWVIPASIGGGVLILALLLLPGRK